MIVVAAAAVVSAGCRDPGADLALEATGAAIRGPVVAAASHPEVCLVGSVGCVGTLIAPNVVLTAAHCLYQQRSWSVTCPYSSDPGRVTASEGAVAPSWPARNPDAVGPDDGADVGLIRLDRPLRETRLGKVNLGAFATGGRAYAIGRVDNGKYSSSGLFVSQTMAISAQDTNHRYWVAVDHAVGEGGDSGGPLILEESQEIIGVDSLGGDACNTKKICEVFGMVGADPAWFNATLARMVGGPAPADAAVLDAPPVREAGPDDAAAVADGGDAGAGGTGGGVGGAGGGVGGAAGGVGGAAGGLVGPGAAGAGGQAAPAVAGPGAEAGTGCNIMGRGAQGGGGAGAAALAALTALLVRRPRRRSKSGIDPGTSGAPSRATTP